MLYQKYTEIIKKLNHFFDKKKQPVVFVHVDLFRSFRLNYNNKNDFFKQHYELIKKITNYSKLIFPCFNYNFPNTKIFNIEKSKSQTDYFTEYFRIKFSKMRTNVPIFSVTANYKLNLSNKFKTINPFGKNSIFHYLYKKNANILYYGAPFSSSTFIMYVEDTFKNGPIYRYKKLIKGKIIDKKNKKNITLSFHVRPKNKKYYLEYDWKKIERELIKNKIIFIYNAGITRIKIINIKKVTSFLHKKMKKDQFYLIDKKSKKWVIPMFKKLKRRFILDDFKN